MNKSERIELLREAQDKLQEAHDLITEAVEGTESEGNVEAYLLDPLAIMISEEHGFLSNDLNIDKVISYIEEEEEEDLGEEVK